MKSRLACLAALVLIALAAMHEEAFLLMSPVRYWAWKLDDPAYRLQALGEIRLAGPAALPVADRLVAQLGRQETNVPEEASRALVAIGAPAVPLLRAALASDDELMVANAAGTLGKLGRPAMVAVPDIIDAAPRVKNHSFTLQRGLACLTLGTDLLWKAPDRLDAELAMMVCQQQRDTVRWALLKLPSGDMEQVIRIDETTVKKLAAVPPDGSWRSASFLGDQVGCPSSGARFVRDQDRVLCSAHP